jgi:hypothetical protein
MTRRRPLWLNVAITAAAAAVVIGVGVQAIAAPAPDSTTPSNYQGPHQTTRQFKPKIMTNYHGPARVSPVHGTTLQVQEGTNQP